eukprot:5862596-Alexandrium_andersonii.AAC.1
MSASLVGSEMCIRDSPSAPPASPARLGPQLVGKHAPHGPPEKPCSAAVSYTHLTLPTICSV